MTQVYEHYLRSIHMRDWYFLWFGLVLPVVIASVIYALERIDHARPVVIGVFAGAIGSVIYAILAS